MLILYFSLKFFIGPKHQTFIHVFTPQMVLLEFFKEISSCSDKLISIAIFQWLVVDPTVMLQVKGILHQLNRTMVKKKNKKKEEEEKSQQTSHFAMVGFEPTNSVSRAELLCPLDPGAQPFSMKFIKFLTLRCFRNKLIHRIGSCSSLLWKKNLTKIT